MGSGDMQGAIDRTVASNPKLAVMGTTLIDPPYADADQIADAVAFLMSDEARFITAEHLSVDGGAQLLLSRPQLPVPPGRVSCGGSGTRR